MPGPDPWNMTPEQQQQLALVRQDMVAKMGQLGIDPNSAAGRQLTAQTMQAVGFNPQTMSPTRAPGVQASPELGFGLGAVPPGQQPIPARRHRVSMGTGYDEIGRASRWERA